MSLSMPMPSVVVMPTALKGQTNGNVSATLLDTVEPDKTSLIYLMEKHAARGMRALHAAALAAGIILTTTGRGRTYQQQYDLFFQRYSPTVVAGSSTKVFNGKTYWLRKGMAMAAIPGTSNHGLWLADDLAEMVGGKLVSLRATTVQWLYANAPHFGFYWETSSENWHVRWTVGDTMPQAVLDYEASLQHSAPPVTPPAPEPTPTVFPPFNPEAGQYSLYPLDTGKSTIAKGATGDTVKYLQAILKNKASQEYVYITGTYDDLTVWGVTALQKFVGQTQNGICDHALWTVIDHLATS